MSNEDAPKNIGEWQTSASHYKVARTTIHNLELNSASKFKFPHFLSLRVLLKNQKAVKFKPEEFGLGTWVGEAKRELTRYGSWRSYRHSLLGSNSEGTFALARFYQKQVVQSSEKKDFDFEVVSPVSKHTRGQERIREQERIRAERSIQLNISRLEIQSPATTPRRPTAFINPSTPVGQIIPDAQSTPGRPSPPGSPGSEEYIEKEHPKSKDEQIVNTALIDFLNAFIIHLTGAYVQWTLHRKAFRAVFSNKSEFEARTDGYLEDKYHNIHAIVEVKPIVRGKAGLRILMQEAAQIVAWIKDEPDNQRIFTNGR